MIKPENDRLAVKYIFNKFRVRNFWFVIVLKATCHSEDFRKYFSISQYYDIEKYFELLLCSEGACSLWTLTNLKVSTHKFP